MELIRFKVGELRLTVCPGEGNRLLFCPGEAEETARAVEYSGVPVPWAAVEGFSWNEALSPWPGKGVFRLGGDFTGGADSFLTRVKGELLPLAEEALSLRSPQRAVIGYSLAGLFALYTLYRTDLFSMAASVSGSLWYEGFTAFAEKTPFAAAPMGVYLSLGEREPLARNPRLRAVGAETEHMAALLRDRGVPTVLEWNSGNHFVNTEVRLAAAIRWLYSGHSTASGLGDATQ